MRFRGISALLGILGLAASAGACRSRPIDLAHTLQLADITSGWYDAGVVEGNKNKLVPSIAFRLKNVGDRIPGSVQVNAVFRRAGETEEWGSALIRAVDASGLEAGATTNPIVLRNELGYTGTDPRAELLRNRLFVDANVQVFAKYGSAQWAKLAEVRIERQLLTR